MKFIAPLTITDGMLTSSSLPETDYAAWNGATAYTTGERVIRASTHRIYQRLTNGTSPTAPELDAVNWVVVGPTNRWAPFDQAVGSVATSSSTISYVLTPGQAVTGLALLDLSADAVAVDVSVLGTSIYSQTWDPVVSSASIADWFAYFFDSIERRGSLVITNLPAYADAVITVTISGAAPLEVGTLAIGNAYDLGRTLAGTSVGIIDYSNKVTDQFGVTTVTERSYAKRMSANVVVRTSSVSDIAKRLAAVRAKPVVWIGEDTVEATLIYGWCRDWSVDLQYPTISHCSLTVDGLV